MKKILKITRYCILILVVLGIGITIAFQVSPKLSASIIKRMFSGDVVIKDPHRYQAAKQSVKSIKDLEYESVHALNRYDIYVKADYSEPRPVLFWLHGGGFVGGDKKSIDEFATYLVDALDIAVVSMNYQLAPDLKYPGQVQQVDELYRFFLDHNGSGVVPEVDLSRVFFGGDSAGAQIALQYTLIQSNSRYANEVGITPSVPLQTVRGVLSFCGPVDLKQTVSQPIEDATMSFFINTVAWSLTGDKQWRSNPIIDEASLVGHMTSDFPATYITDGNRYSFQSQGIALYDRLTELGVPVEGLFYQDDVKAITHEYQFEFQNEEAKDNLERTLRFMKMLLDESAE